MDRLIDIAVVGAGPAGLSAAINAVARGKTVRLLSSESNYLRKAERVDNYLGFYDVSGQALMDAFVSHANGQGILLEPGKVANILPFGEGFMLNFGGDIVEARAVVLSTGVSKAKALPGEKELLGRGVSYCATCDGMLYRGKRAVVFGESEDAAEEANFLASIGVQVTYVSSAARKKHLREDIPYVEGRLSSILGEDTVTGAVCGEQTLPAQAVFLLRDSIAPSTLLDGLDTENGYVRVNRWMETNVPGVYAAGDCTGKPLQISKAVGEGLIAAQQAALYIDNLMKKGE